ncbi:MAG: methyltransferase [Clostridium sp.]|nr:methyltransferase [Clostridium sp.]
MNKLIVEVYVPASGNKYEMRIQATIQMYKILELIKKAVAEFEDGRYKPDDTAVLCDKITGNIINLNMTANELGIKNGSKLMII